MKYWSPFGNQTTQISANLSVVPKPEVGDFVLLMFFGDKVSVIDESTIMPDGAKIITAEIKTVRTAKITLEEDTQ